MKIDKKINMLFSHSSILFVIILVFLTYNYYVNIYINDNKAYIEEFSLLFRDLSPSQHKEDYYILNYLINKKEDIRNKTFIEMGAYDGITYSNTYLFEKYFRWNGLLIEASPSNFKKLEKSGRNSKKIYTAVCDKKEIEFIDGAKAGNGDISEIMEKYLKNMKKDTIKIPCQKMTDLLINNMMTDIFFFSLDVEGSEISVINTTDFNIIKSIIHLYIIVKYFLIEFNGYNGDKNQMIKDNVLRNILIKKKFKYIMRIEINELWLNMNYK